MAATATANSHNLNGKWQMNSDVKVNGKTTTDIADEILTFQGIGWITRKAIKSSTVHINIFQDVDDKGLENVNIVQVSTFATTVEKRCLDWEERGHNDKVFGDVVGKSRRIALANLKNGLEDSDFEDKDFAFLSEGWEPEENDELIQTMASQKKAGWTAVQVWGFQTVDGQRRYCRKLVVRKGKGDKNRVQALMVYDYVGEADASLKP